MREAVHAPHDVDQALLLGHLERRKQPVVDGRHGLQDAELDVRSQAGEQDEAGADGGGEPLELPREQARGRVRDGLELDRVDVPDEAHLWVHGQEVLNPKRVEEFEDEERELESE